MRRFSSCVSRVAGVAAARFYATPGKVTVKVTTQDGTAVAFEAPTGTSLMHAIRDVAKLEVEGACDGCMQCSTCHVYLSAASYKQVGEPGEDEQDVLDKSLDVKETSRLACQIQLSPEMEGMEVELPKNVVNLLM